MLLMNEPIKQGVMELLHRGVKGRTITEVTEENIPYLKELFEIAGDAGAFRHLDNVTGNFSISDGKIYQSQIMGDLSAPSSYSESTNKTSNDFSTDPNIHNKQQQASTSLLPLDEQLKFNDNTKTATAPQSILSTIKGFVEQQQYIFEMMWNKAIPAEQMIKQIEQGIKPAFIETLRDPLEIQNVALDLITSAKEEVLAIFSTTDAFILQKQIGIINLLDIASNRGIPVKLLTPYNSSSNIDNNSENNYHHNQGDTADINIAIKTESPKHLKKKRQYFVDSENKLKSVSQSKKTINSRFIGYDMQTKVSILIVDRKLCLTVELKDNANNNNNSSASIGLSTYSNSKPTVSSYVTIFEALWRQVDLINEINKSKHKLEYANKKLKISDKKMKEFVNIAAHELRTPLQPIISYNMLAKRGMIDKDEALDVIDKYSKRLQNLSADLLAVGKIESGSLLSNFEKLSIKDLILDTVESVIKSQPELIRGPKKILVDLNSKDLDSCNISADKQKVTQLLTNLLNNAIKFTEQGDIRIEGNIIFLSNNSSNHSDIKKHKSIQIKIRDTGMGIPKDILPNIFEKFVTKGIKVGKDLKQGTGLGLFICRSIVKLHKGKIFAYNNDDKGATFVIELPIRE